MQVLIARVLRCVRTKCAAAAKMQRFIFNESPYGPAVVIINAASDGDPCKLS